MRSDSKEEKDVRERFMDGEKVEHLPFSSGLGKGTVGNSGSGSCCSLHRSGVGKSNVLNARRRKGVPTPWRAVWTKVMGGEGLLDLGRRRRVRCERRDDEETASKKD